MADQSDVEQALVAAATAALYPAGVSGASAIGGAARVYRGWPVGNALDADLRGGVVNVSVFAVPQSARNTTRWPIEPVAMPAPPTLTVTVAGNSAQFGGSADAGQLAGILIGNAAYVHRTVGGDTPALVAAILAQSIRATRTAWLAGSGLTVPGVSTLIARTVADAPVISEFRRQEQQFRISVWAPDPVRRDRASAAVDAALATVGFLTLADGTGGRLRFANTASFDQNEDATLYRRDLVYAVEYPTTQGGTDPCMLFGDLVVNGTTILA